MKYGDYVDDIVKNMRLISGFIQDQTLESFSTDIKTLYAVIRCLEIIGEAVKRLPDEVKDRYPDIPWKAMAGMRDRLIHGYDTVDSQIVWNTVKNTMPGLLSRFEHIYRKLMYGDDFYSNQ